MLKYGSDKPDLRNPLYIIDLSNFFLKNVLLNLLLIGLLELLKFLAICLKASMKKIA